MTGISDGRVAAWTNAWQCVEAAQNTRNEVFRVESKRRDAGDTSPNDDLFFSQSSTLYNALMREAEVFSQLAHVPTDVGVFAGTVIRDYERRKSEQKAEQSEFIERVTNSRNRCADCGTRLTSENRSQVTDGESITYVCREHYDERTRGVDDVQG